MKFQNKNIRPLLSALIAALSINVANADQVIADDLIVQGSNCIGIDCVNNESFGFDTLRLKENNLRITAVDTSSSASFPTNDWQITFNDSADGGQNKFSIDDIDGGKTPFTIEAGAPSNSLYVDSSKNVGLGTSTPALNLHILDGDTPAMRLEQDSSSGFTAQIWDVAGNEANFFIRDVTNGSKLPFKIIPNAPTNSLYVASNGNIGLGTASPAASLHAKRTDGTASLKIEETSGTAAVRELVSLVNNGGSYITMENTSVNNTWWMTHENRAPNGYLITNSVGGVQFRLNPNGNLTISGSIFTNGGTCGSGCDAVFDDKHKIESIEEHANEMWKNHYLPSVGPTIENTQINLSDKTGRMLNELEKAHIYIADLNTEIQQKDAKVEKLISLVTDLERRLSKLENK